jgi:cytochrome b561
MAESHVLERIDAWHAAGLIDDATAERLRTAESAASVPSDARPDNPLQAASAMFGPPVTIVELFAYLGAGFLLAAWHVLAPNNDFSEAPKVIDQSIRWLVPAVAFGVIGLIGRSGSPQLGRAAGVAFAIATIHAYGLFEGILRPGYLDLTEVVVAGLTVLAALAFRRLHPAVLTQLTILGALLLLAAVAFRWLGATVFGADTFDRPAAESTARALMTMAWWLGWAVGLGLLARLEWRIGDDAPPSRNPAEEARARRGRVTRLIAGLTAVFAVTSGAMVSGIGGRALPAWLGDLAILAVSGILLAIAIRFGALAYLLPAALGLIVALTDLNSQYVVERTGVGVALVVEGLILIGTGLVAERLRRAMARRRMPADGPPPTMPAGASSPTAPSDQAPPTTPPTAEDGPSEVPTP